MILDKTRSLIKLIDIYGAKVEFNFQKQIIHKTVFGGIVSLFIFACLGVGCYFFGIELIAKKQPIIITNERFVRTPQRMDFDKTQQTIMVGLRDKDTLAFKDPTILKVRAQQKIMKKDKQGATVESFRSFELKDLKLKPCTIDDMRVESLKPYFSSFELQYYYCFDDSEEIYIEGDFDAEKFVKVEVLFEQCRNSTEPDSIICSSQEIIDERLSLGYFEAYFIDKMVDPTILNNPFQLQGRNIFSLTSSKMGKEVHALFANYYVYTDVGVIYEQIEKTRDFVFTQQLESFSFEDPSIIVKFVLKTQKHREYIMSRRYLKIPDIIAQIGGMLKMVIMFGYFVTSPFIALHLNKKIANNIFNFDCNDKILNQQSNKKQITIQNNKNNQLNKEIFTDNNQTLQTYYRSDVQIQQTKCEEKQLAQENDKNISETQNNCKYNSDQNIQIPYLKQNSLQQNKEQENQIDHFKDQQLQKSPSNDISLISSNTDSSNPKFQLQFNQKYKNINSQKRLKFKKKENKLSLEGNFQYSYQSNRSRQDTIISDQTNINGIDNVNTKATEKNITSLNNIVNMNRIDHQQNDKKSPQQKDELNTNQFIKNFKDYLKPITNVVFYKCCDYFQHICKPFTKDLKLKKKYIDHSIEIIKERLNIQYILNKFLEIDNLKSVLLNEDQMKLFEYLPKPIITFDKKTNKPIMRNYYYTQPKSTKEKEYDAYQSFQNILIKDQKSHQDIKLIQMLETKKNELEINQLITCDIHKQPTLQQNIDNKCLQTNTQDENKQNINQMDEGSPVILISPKEQFSYQNQLKSDHINFMTSNSKLENSSHQLDYDILSEMKTPQQKKFKLVMNCKNNSKNV